VKRTDAYDGMQCFSLLAGQSSNRRTNFWEASMRSENYISTVFESHFDSRPNLKKIFSVHGNTVMSVSDLRTVVRKRSR